MVLTVKILVICQVLKGVAPWASVWCGGKHANSYPLKPLTGGSYTLRASGKTFSWREVLDLDLLFRAPDGGIENPRRAFLDFASSTGRFSV